ncbi:MAG: hypothetical protein JJU36_10315 [Phycisphaeraceae bacterium]|nr:hypothetical protein [Phycisphaeraceae bacterium]
MILRDPTPQCARSSPTGRPARSWLLFACLGAALGLLAATLCAPPSLAVGILGDQAIAAPANDGPAASAPTEPQSKPDALQATMDAFLGHPIVALFAVIAVGMALGQITVANVALGSSGVVFAAILLGHLGYRVPEGVGGVGLVLFVYCVGITAGPSFFRVFVRQGKILAHLSVVIILTAVVTTLTLALLIDVPAELAAGLFAGSLTSTPALASALDVAGADSPLVSIGYGIAYPFGVIGVVLFVQLLPRLLGSDFQTLERQSKARQGRDRRIVRVLVEVLNPSVTGKSPTEIPFISDSACQVSRRLEGGRLAPIDAGFTFQPGVHVLIVGEDRTVGYVVDFLGKRSEERFYMDTERERRQVVVSSRAIIGQSIQQLNPLKNYGIIISRISRLGVDFVPRGETVVQSGDTLWCVGDPENLQKFSDVAGHRAKLVDETDVISMAVGITVGVLLGMAPITLPGGNTFTLGMAGGPLLVALILGHFGRVGRLVGHIPRASRLVMGEIGLVLFLADAGVRAGGAFVDVVGEFGPMLLLMGAAVTLLPMIVGYLVARYWLKLPLLEILGATCGGMTSTPGLGALTSRTDADSPAIAYAASYPVALILMTISAQLLIALLR